MKILFIGCVEFSKNMLNKLISLNAEIAGVITKKESGFNSDFADLTEICIENSIPYQYFNDINSKEALDWIKSLNIDVIYCFGWSNLLKKEILNSSKMGVVGYHPASLPLNRGRHPLIWALFLGLKQTASTFFFMDEGADSGDILSQEPITITDEDDAKSLYDKMTDTAINQIEILHYQLETSTYKKTPQAVESNSWRKRGYVDGQIDFRMTGAAIYNLVRALTKPYVGAHILYKNQEVKVWKAEIVHFDKNNIEPGKVLDLHDEKIIVKTYDGAIKLIEHDFIRLPLIGEYL